MTNDGIVKFMDLDKVFQDVVMLTVETAASSILAAKYGEVTDGKTKKEIEIDVLTLDSLSESVLSAIQYRYEQPGGTRMRIPGRLHRKDSLVAITKHALENNQYVTPRYVQSSERHFDNRLI